MNNKKQNKGKQLNEQPKANTRWVTVSLNKEHLADLRDWGNDFETLVSEVTALIAGGCSLNFKRDAGSGVVSAFLFVPSPDGSNVTYGISARSIRFQDALIGVLYKYLVVLDGDPASGTASNDDWIQ